MIKRILNNHQNSILTNLNKLLIEMAFISQYQTIKLQIKVFIFQNSIKKKHYYGWE